MIAVLPQKGGDPPEQLDKHRATPLSFGLNQTRVATDKVRSWRSHLKLKGARGKALKRQNVAFAKEADAPRADLSIKGGVLLSPGSVQSSP